MEYEKLVYKIVRKYCYNKNDFEDLFQEGMVALEKAARNYKEDSDADFSSYAYFYIKGEILKYIRENRVIRISRDTIRLNSLINSTREKLEQHYGRVITLDEIARFLEIPVEKISETIEVNDYVRSLDYVLSDDGKELDVYDCVGYDEYNYDANIMDLREELLRLNEDERKLINLRYYEGRTQQETSDMLGMSQVQVSRKEGKILTKLNSRLAA